MTGEDRERWDRRHAAVSSTVPMPPDALRTRSSLLPTGGAALDVACGSGQVAVWLALRGFDVTAVDVSPVALSAGAALADAHGVTVRWVESDLDDGLPAGRYDVVVCQRFRDPTLYPALAAALSRGGLLVVTVLSEVGDEGGRFRAAPGELRSAFGGLDVLHREERDGEATLLARG